MYKSQDMENARAHAAMTDAPQRDTHCAEKHWDSPETSTHTDAGPGQAKSLLARIHTEAPPYRRSLFRR